MSGNGYGEDRGGDQSVKGCEGLPFVLQNPSFPSPLVWVCVSTCPINWKLAPDSSPAHDQGSLPLVAECGQRQASISGMWAEGMQMLCHWLKRKLLIWTFLPSGSSNVPMPI